MRAPAQQPAASGKTFSTDTAVDFVIVGSGVAGASVARELTAKGFDVLILEQGRKVEPADMEHDELGAFRWPRWTNDPALSPQTFRAKVEDKTEVRHFVRYARAVGGTTLHFTGNFWRFRPIDFREHSTHATSRVPRSPIGRSRTTNSSRTTRPWNTRSVCQVKWETIRASQRDQNRFRCHH